MGLIDRVDINCRGDWLAEKLMCGRTEPNAKHSTARKAVRMMRRSRNTSGRYKNELVSFG